MAISRDTVQYLAHLARVGFNNTGDMDALQADLNNIVDMVNQISAVDTEGVIPMAHPLETTQAFRPDETTETDQRDKLLSLAPKPGPEAGLFLVPKVIED